ncbi:MAG TPA: DUF4339 domain-containing protein [Daejeonella sp.]|nr:DUF4339 domain-containing protein [Daejeonella sp.]
MRQYFIQTRTGQEGPFTIEELSKRELNPDTLVWFKGQIDWAPAGKIQALNSLFASATSPSPEPVVVPDHDGPKSGFKLSLFHWTIIGVLLIAAFIYFVRPGDPGNTMASHSDSVIDSTAIVAAEAAAEKNRARSELAAKNLNYRNNWVRYIKADASNFKTNTFGGIYQLEVVVQNQTDYPLDEVNISVSYIKENGGTHKTENVTVYNVPAHGKASAPAPDSNRGKSLSLEIIKIRSKKMNFLYAPDVRIEGRNDPYYKVN